MNVAYVFATPNASLILEKMIVPQLEEGRLLEKDQRLGRGDAHARGGPVENRRRAKGASETRGRGSGKRHGRKRRGHQEKDLGTSGTPENGGRSGDAMRPCAAARR